MVFLGTSLLVLKLFILKVSKDRFMTVLFLILIIVASALLAFFVLIQNPKGGGLSGNIAGFSTQFMGVKQTSDVLEKGTWILTIVVAVLCIVSSLFIKGSSSAGSNAIDKLNPGVSNSSNGAGLAPNAVLDSSKTVNMVQDSANKQ
jgi:preprotein translocase subunit SecG